MLEKYFLRPTTVDRIRSNWLAPQIESYVEWMHREGYADRNVFQRVPLLCHFADFTRQRGVTNLVSARSRVDEFVRHWLRHHEPQRGTARARRQVMDATRCPVQQMLALALEGRVTRHHLCRPFPFQTEAPGFLAYLRQERGLREKTIYDYDLRLNSFSDYLKRLGVTSLKQLSPALLTSFVVHTAPKLSHRGRIHLCGDIRVFLRFCYRERIIWEDLSGAVEIPRVYRLAEVPRSITWDEVRRMLATVDRRTPHGRRDYAILLLLVIYALRAHEVANLTLDDIDWKHERLRVLQRKAGHSTAYPLAGVMAEALIDYLQHGRPNTHDRHLFFRALAPLQPLSNGAISGRAATYLHKAGVKVHHPGAHTLRHTCVQRLVDAEFPLKMIGDYVGHRSLSSTEIYSKVALATLREVAMGDGEAL
jgi:integrase/recombinase XerD